MIDLNKIKPGNRLNHLEYGNGTVIEIEFNAVAVDFDDIEFQSDYWIYDLEKLSVINPID